MMIPQIVQGPHKDLRPLGYKILGGAYDKLDKFRVVIDITPEKFIDEIKNGFPSFCDPPLRSRPIVHVVAGDSVTFNEKRKGSDILVFRIFSQDPTIDVDKPLDKGIDKE